MGALILFEDGLDGSTAHGTAGTGTAAGIAAGTAARRAAGTRRTGTAAGTGGTRRAAGDNFAVLALGFTTVFPRTVTSLAANNR